jgi:hypothetical protein
MDDHEAGSGAEQRLDEELAEEMRRLQPLLQRQRQATAVQPEPGFRQALRAQLTAAPKQGATAGWRTFIAMLVPAPLQFSLRGQGSHVLTYAAGEVTISLTARPAYDPGGGLISLYGEVDDSGGAAGADAAMVEVLRGEAVVASTTLDEQGNFVLRDLPPRVYALRLRFPDRREVVIPPAGYAAEGESGFP